MDGETLSAHAARAQHNRLPARLAMKAHRCHHLAAKPIRATIWFDLMAHLDGGVHGARRRSRQNAAVVKQHCGRAVMVVVREARINEFPAGPDGGVKICFLHGAILVRSAIAGADPPGGQWPVPDSPNVCASTMSCRRAWKIRLTTTPPDNLSRPARHGVRSRLVHGAQYPASEEIKAVRDEAGDLTRRGLLRAVREGFPDAIAFNRPTLGIDPL